MTTVLALLFLACGASDPVDSAAPCVVDADGAYPTWGTFGAAFFLDYCASCHAASAPQRFGAPASVSFDAEADVLAHFDAVRRTVLDAQTMPKGGGVPSTQLLELERYLNCLEAEP